MFKLKNDYTMQGRFRLTKTEVIENRLLDLNESLEALGYIGFDDVSVHLIRQYQTRRLINGPQSGPSKQAGAKYRGLINGPQSGPSKQAGAKYRGYFSANDILAIVDIRLRLRNGETLEEIGFDTRSFWGQKHQLYILERMLLRKNLATLKIFDNLFEELNIDADAKQQIIDLTDLIRKYEKAKDLIDLKTLGLNIDPKYSKKLDEFLDKKFEKG